MLKSRSLSVFSVVTALVVGGSVFVTYSAGQNPIDKTGGRSSQYMNQFMYLEVTDADAQAQFDMENEIIANQSDATVDWTYFDKLYTTSLSSSVQVELAYSILSKKDLVSLVYDNPNDQTYVSALKKYVNVLTANGYLGYTLIYSALDALKAAKEDTFVASQAAIIKTYGANDTWHTGVIAGGYQTMGTQDAYDKVVSDFTYLEKIGSL